MNGLLKDKHFIKIAKFVEHNFAQTGFRWATVLNIKSRSLTLKLSGKWFTLLRLEPGSCGWRPQTPPLCFEVPKPTNIVCFNFNLHFRPTTFFSSQIRFFADCRDRKISFDRKFIIPLLSQNFFHLYLLIFHIQIFFSLLISSLIIFIEIFFQFHFLPFFLQFFPFFEDVVRKSFFNFELKKTFLARMKMTKSCFFPELHIIGFFLKPNRFNFNALPINKFLPRIFMLLKLETT